ncbi:DUF4124 domain-containing protein [Reinekea sp.]|uniref:DUF4124 domain-containing protein n=1 Tax=Reinekea sp. TaxID=1970455 RepID=UPI002A82A33E|nr:DUF4124 domain-containing protein [Reinekea sp.]
MKRTNHMLQRLTILLILTLPLSVFASGKIYTWTDASGIVHYGDRPPLEIDAEEIAIQGKKKQPLVVVSEQLPGQWFGAVNDGGEVKLTLSENGTITYIQTRADQSVYNYQGIWSLNNTALTVITEFSQTAPPGGNFKRSVEPIQLVYNIIAFSENAIELIIGTERFSLLRLTQ